MPWGNALAFAYGLGSSPYFYPPYNKPTYVIDGNDVIEFFGFTHSEDIYFEFLAYEKLWEKHPEKMEASLDRWLRNIGKKVLKKAVSA